MSAGPYITQRSATPCKDCGKADFSISFIGDTKKVMDREGVCFDCAYWRMQLEKQHQVVIDGRIYSLGNVNKPPNSPHAGMAGRRFVIEFFDGRRVTTHDLWSGSEIPAHLRERIPDNARFLGGAGFVRVGDGGCWNPSANPATSQDTQAEQGGK